MFNHTVDTIVELRAAPLVDGPVHVKGFSTPNDGGGGVFYWDTSVGQLNDNVGIVITSNVSGAGKWRRDGFRYQGSNVESANFRVNVRWFGAKGDGVTDDTIACQKATLAAQVIFDDLLQTHVPSGTSDVPWPSVITVFPAGVYSFSNIINLDSGVEVYSDIEGEGQAVLQTDDPTLNIIRWPVAGYNIRNIVFRGGLHAIAMFGTSQQLGGVMGPTADGNAPALIDHCHFNYQIGPSIWQDCGALTTVASGSDGVTLPISGGILHVVTTSSFPSVGSIGVEINGVFQIISYTGKTTNTFTGCTGGTGTLHTGQLVVINGMYRTFQACLRITNYYHIGPHLYWGAGDTVIFDIGHIEQDNTSFQTTGDGFPLGLFNSTDTLYVSNTICVCVGQTPVSRQALFIGDGVMHITNWEYGQNDGICLIRQKTVANTYAGTNGVSIRLPESDLALILILDHVGMVGAFGAYWLEVYENLPGCIKLNGNDEGNDWFGTYGVWIDAAVSMSAGLGVQTAASIFQMDGFSEFSRVFKIWQGFDQGPSQLPSYAFATEVTSYFVNKKLRDPLLSERGGLGSEVYQENLLAVTGADAYGIANFSLSDGTTSGSTTTDTSTGYSLTTITAPVTAVGACVASWTLPYANLMANNLPAGLYCFSMYWKCNWDGAIWFTANPSGGDGGATALKWFDGSNQFQRLDLSFFYPGNNTTFSIGATTEFLVPVPITTWTASTVYRASTTGGTFGSRVTNGGNVYLCIATTGDAHSAASGGPTGTGHAIVDNHVTWDYVGPGGTFTPQATCGLFMLNKGRHPALYVFPQNADSGTKFGWIPRTYYGTSAPTSGTYVVGDVVINTTPSDGGPYNWVCTVAGTPGTWLASGSLTNKAALVDGSSDNRGVLKLWDATAGAYKYIYIDGGSITISDVLPT